MSYEIFTFRGISSDTMAVMMSDEWLDSIAPTVYDVTDIPGRDGAIYEETHRKDIEIEIPCILTRSAKKEDLKAWLHGSGKLLFKNRQREARILDQISFQRVGYDHEAFTIPMILSPYWEDPDGYETLTISAGSTSFENAGNVNSKPQITLRGSGTVTITAGGVTFDIDFSACSDNTIDIDCAAKSESDPAGITIDWTYPEFTPGQNTISWSGSGSVSAALIQHKSRWA